MKILFFIDTLLSGGKERRLAELIKSLKNNPECEFELAVMSNEIHYKEVLDLDIPIHYLIRRSKKDFFVIKDFYKLCRNYKPDIVHCWDSMTAVFSFPVCKILKIKLINSMIADAPENLSFPDKKWIRSRLSFPFSDIIIGNSKAGLTAYNAPDSKSYYIHNGFDFRRINTIEEKNIVRSKLDISTKFVVGMVATYSKAKDYKTFFKAANMILDKRRDVTFIVLGNHTDSVPARNSIPPEFSEFFRLLGKKSGIESYINAMDIGVLATFTEGISNSILEYMALGKPVIATSGSGTTEIVIDGETGFLVKRSEAHELAEKTELLLNDDNLRNTMGKAGRKRVMEYFNIENMTNKYFDIYKIVLNPAQQLRSGSENLKVTQA